MDRETRRTDGWTTPNQYPSASAGDRKSFGNIYVQLLLCSKSSTSNLPSEIIINNECITGSEKIASTLNKYFASVAEQFQDKILKESSNAYSEQFAMKALLC